jgi:transposase
MSKKNLRELISGSLEGHGYTSAEAQEVFLLEMETMKFFQFENVIPQCLTLENIERDEKEILYYWNSNSDHAECPDCHTISNHERKDSQSKPIQDIATDGLAVYHDIKAKRFYCDNPECKTKIFVERFYEFTEEKARKTLRFKKHCRELALACGNLGAEYEIRAEGSVVCDDTISKYIKEAAAKVTKANTESDNVKILSIDDFNTRKGDSSSGCTVFIDQESHKVLIIIKGTTKEVVQKVIEKFPSAKFLSRDRACSLSSAGDACGKIQVADQFHLVQNIHKAIEEALTAEMPANIFIKEGDGWVKSTQQSDEKEVNSVPDEDLGKRIQLAGLTESKAEKYRNTLKMLEMSDKGLRTADIAKALGIPYNEVKGLRRSAASTIRDVQDKINKRIEKFPKNMDGRGRAPKDGNLKTLGANPKPARESIVEPYRDIVVEMWNAGNSPDKIFPVIVDMGFTGCRNAVYQYIWKLEYEDPCVLTRKIKRKNPGTPWTDSFNKQDAQNLPDLSLESVPRNAVYKSILKECKDERYKEDQSVSEMKTESMTDDQYKADSNVIKDPCPTKSKKPAMAKYSPLEPEILDLMYGVDDAQPEKEVETLEDKQKGKKKRSMKG